jgi:alanine racemase
MYSEFRQIPPEAFGINPVIRIRNIDAVVHNYRLFKEKADKTGSECAAVLKGEVHGLVMKDVAPALYKEGARIFFVAELFEGIELREILPHKDAKIYTLAGILEGEEEHFHQHAIRPCINCLEQLEGWNSCCRKQGCSSAIIHLDSHMNRLGLLDDEVKTLSENFDRLTSHVKIDYYMSHFYDIKGDDHTNCYGQLEVLKSYLEVLPEAPVTFACTDSVILLDNDEFNFDMIRPGIGLVGGAPNADTPVSPDARHTLEIYAKTSQIKTVPKGKTVGYSGAYTTNRDTKIALVHIGYKDGYMRALSGLDNNTGAYMQIDRYRVPVIGKISLDATTIDVTDVPDSVLQTVKYAEVTGPNVDLRKLADFAGCYELMVALGRPNKKIADYTEEEFNQKFKNI